MFSQHIETVSEVYVLEFSASVLPWFFILFSEMESLSGYKKDPKGKDYVRQELRETIPSKRQRLGLEIESPALTFSE